MATKTRGKAPRRHKKHPLHSYEDNPKHLVTSAAELDRLQAREEEATNNSERLAGGITAFSGSMLFVGLHALWFTLWIVANELFDFDPFPYQLLTMVVSLEAIFLSTFVLISQNRQSAAADKRAKVDLQVNMIAEQEVTKLIRLVSQIHDHLGIEPEDDTELEEMEQPVLVQKLADIAEDAETGSRKR